MSTAKKDIASKRDIELMVNSFYARVNQDPLLSPVFNDVAQVDWETHLPKMYRFWNSLIFGEASYKGNPFGVHLPLPIEEKHFDQWLNLFHQNIDELFVGPLADHTKQRASSIAHIFESKLTFIQNTKSPDTRG